MRKIINPELLLSALLIVVAMYLFLPRYQLVSNKYQDGSSSLYMIDMRTSKITLCEEINSNGIATTKEKCS